MSRKFTFKEVKKYFKDHDCELLEKEYVNSMTPMRYRCDCGNDECKICFSSFKSGVRCKKCGYKKLAKKRSFDYKYVYNYFKERDCELLEKEYINSYTPMRYRCDCGNDECTITFASFKSGSKCKKCCYIRISKSRVFTYKYVYNYFKEHDCELLEKEYINANTPMKYKCSCGESSRSTFASFKSGVRCKKCGIKKRTFDYKYVCNYFKERDCELLEKEYINCVTKMRYRCDCGNDECEITFHSFRQGNRCKKCANAKNTERQTFTYEEVYKYFEDHDCELLEEEYKGCNYKMRYRCSCGNDECKTTFHSFKAGHRCMKCATEKRTGKNNWRWIEDREEAEERKKFSDRCRYLLKNALRKTNQLKTGHTYKMLGYNSEKLRQYIYAHFNWEKVKDKVYHIDHYFSIKAFLDYSIKDLKLINCLENLQPLTEKDNLKKGSKYDEKEFEGWLIGKGYEIICE